MANSFWRMNGARRRRTVAVKNSRRHAARRLRGRPAVAGAANQQPLQALRDCPLHGHDDAAVAAAAAVKVQGGGCGRRIFVR